MVANLGQPIGSTLNIPPAGNPILGLAGGIGGLAQQYGQDYNSYLSTNMQNYQNITAGYGTVMQNVANSLGQGGSDWGIAQPAANSIVMAGNRAAGGAIQNSINSGVGKSTAAVAAQRGVTEDTQQALGGLGANLAGQYAGYESQIGQNELGFMNSVNAPPPNAAAYGALAQQYGATQQNAANLAMQQQALDQQRRSANLAASRGMSGSGGVSIPNAPRGGTYGSGASGFASGSGVTPTAGGGGGGGGGKSQVDLGNGIVYPGGVPNQGGIMNAAGPQGYDPWSNPSGAGSNPLLQGIGNFDPSSGDPSQVTGNFGNTGFYLGSGVG